MSRRREPAEVTDAKRLRIERAAAALFSDSGYLDVSMDAIAAKACISKGALYYYFEKKSDVLFAILARSMDALMDGLEADLSTLPPGRERLRRIVRRQLSYYSAHLAEVRTLLNDRHCLDRAQLRAILARQQAYFDIVRGAVDETIGRADGPRAKVGASTPLTFALFGMCNWIPGWFRPGGAIGIDELIDMTTELYLNGLGHFARGRTGQGSTPA